MNNTTSVTSEQSLNWLRPMLDEFGINPDVVTDVHFGPDAIVITCAYSPDAIGTGETPKVTRVASQFREGLDDFSILLYRITIGVEA